MSRAVTTKPPLNMTAAGQLQFNRPQASQGPFDERPSSRAPPRVLRFAILVSLVMAALFSGACDNSSAPNESSGTPCAVSTDSSAGTETGTLIAVDARTGEELRRVQPPMWAVGGPVVAEGLVFVQGGRTCRSPEGTLGAYEAETGEERWRASAAGLCGGASAMSVSDGVAVVQQDRETLQGLDANTGDELWTSPNSDELLWGNAGSVAFVWGDLVFRAFDRHSGEQRWTTAAMSSRPEPVVNATTAFFDLFSCRLLAIDLETGNERWQVSLPPPVSSCSITAGDRLVVRCHIDSTKQNDKANKEKSIPAVITAWDSDTGKELWTANAESFCDDVFPVVAVAPSSVYVLAGETLEALDAESGARRWQAEAPAPPARVVATDDDFVVVISDRTIVAYDARSGERVWETPTLGPGTPSAWVADGIVFLTWSGELDFPE